MRGQLLAAAILAVTVTACSESTPPPPEEETPDAAVGTYDKQPTGQTRSANCGTEVIVDGALYLLADHTWTKVDIGSSPSGSATCGFVGGSWVRNNTTTLTLTPSIAGFTPVNATVVGNDLTLEFSSTPVAYKRRP
jgi:hypothetical protein